MGMTPDRPPIPDAPALPPWVVAYAEYEGRSVQLVDIEPALAVCTCQNLNAGTVRWRVGVGQPIETLHDRECPVRIGGRTFPTVFRTDSEAEALVEYDKQAALLCDGGGGGE